jgi:GDP-D-mannose dehydratase
VLQFDRSSWHILGRSTEVGLFACKVILHNANGSAYVSTFFNAKVRQSAAAVAQHNLKSWRIGGIFQLYTSIFMLIGTIVPSL